MRSVPQRAGDDVRVDLLGRLCVTDGDARAELGDGLPQRLLAFLALRGRWVARDEVAALLWPGHDPERRRTNLRRVLARARAWPWTSGIVADRDGLAWTVTTDVALLADPIRPAAERLALWRGPLFADVTSTDDEDDLYGAWIADERRRLETAFRALTLEHAGELGRIGRPREAIAALEPLVERDPLDEEVVQRLIVAYGEAGQLERARATYRAFADVLERELGLAPLDATRQAVASLNAARSVVTSDGDGAEARPEATVVPLLERDDARARIRSSARGWTVIAGVAGIGKTRVVAEALAGTPTLWIRGATHGAGPPFSAIADALRAGLADDEGRRRLRALPAGLQAAIERVVPATVTVASSLGAPSDLAPNPTASRTFLADALAEAIAAFGRTVVVDDEPDLDDASAEVVVRLLARHRRGGPRVVSTRRSGDGASSGVLARAFDAWRSEGWVEVVTLGPLSAAATGAIVEATCGRALAEGLAERVFELTGGHPLFVVETARHLAEAAAAGDVTVNVTVNEVSSGDADRPSPPLPPSLLETVMARVDRHGPATRRVLEAASLAISPFTLTHVAPATALAPWLALEGVERAVGAGLLVAEAGGYRFAHGLVRSAVADAMPRERRALVEQRLAWALERQRGSPALVAAHYERAGRREAAGRWHRRAADEAEAMFMPAAALEHLTKALDLADGPALAAELHLRRASVLDRLADVVGCRDALEAAEAASRDAGDRGLRARVAVARGEHALSFHDLETVRASAASAFALGAGGVEAARAHFLLGTVARVEGDLTAAHEAYVAALAAAPVSRPDVVGRIHLDGLRRLAQVRGDLDAAIDHARAARAAFSAASSTERRAHADIMLGVLLYLRGAHDADAAIEVLLAGLDAARDAANVNLQRTAILNLLKLHTDRCDLAAAMPLLEEGFALAHDFDEPDEETSFLLAAGWVRYVQGELGSAWDLFERAAAVADAGRNPAFRAFARSVPFNARLAAGELATCAALLEALDGIVTEGALGFMEPRVGLLRARLDLARGSADRALEALRSLAERDDLEVEDAGEVRLGVALALESLGRLDAAAQAALACSTAPTLEVTQAAEALRLRALVAVGAPFADTAAAVRQRLASGRTLPFETVALMLALADAEAAAGNVVVAEELRYDAHALRERLRASVGAREPVASSPEA